MDGYLDSIKLAVAKLDRQKIQLILIIITLILFVLGAGAPGAGGDVSG